MSKTGEIIADESIAKLKTDTEIINALLAKHGKDMIHWCDRELKKATDSMHHLLNKKAVEMYFKGYIDFYDKWINKGGVAHDIYLHWQEPDLLKAFITKPVDKIECLPRYTLLKDPANKEGETGDIIRNAGNNDLQSDPPPPGTIPPPPLQG